MSDEANEVIGKKAVEWGLLDCWHERDLPFDHGCMKCGEPLGITTFNPDYSIYEKLAPVLDKLKELGIFVGVGGTRRKGYTVTLEKVDGGNFSILDFVESCKTWSDLPTTLRDMVAELISKGEI